MSLRTLLLFSACLFVCSPSSAQQGTADLRGRVVDQQAGVLPGVAIVVTHQESGLFRETVSGADGSFLLSAMTPGVYQVSAELQGFKQHQQRNVRLEVGRSAQLELTLEVGGLAESVTVSAEAPLVDTTLRKPCRLGYWVAGVFLHLLVRRPHARVAVALVRGQGGHQAAQTARLHLLVDLPQRGDDGGQGQDWTLHDRSPFDSELPEYE